MGRHGSEGGPNETVYLGGCKPMNRRTGLAGTVLMLLAVLTLTIVGCEEKTPVEPDPDVVIEETVLDEQQMTVGAEGGTLAMEDGMTVEVPAGALTGSTSVRVQKIGGERFFDGPNRSAYRVFVDTEPDEIVLTFPVEPGGSADDIGVLNYDPEEFFQTEADPYPFEYNAETGRVTVRATANRALQVSSGGAAKRSGKIKEKNTWIVEKEPLVEPDVQTKVIDMPFYAQDHQTCWAASIHMMTRAYKADASSIVPDYLKYAGYPPTTGPGSFMYRVKVPSLLNIYAASGAVGSIYWRGTSAFNNLVKQINEGRPVLIGRSGHSVMVIGYKKTTSLYGPAAYQFLVHDPADPNWSNQWKDWTWVIDQSFSWTTFAEVWIPSAPLENRPLQTVGLPLSGANGVIRFTHRTNDGDIDYDATLSIDQNEPKWYGWKRTVSSLKEIPGKADTLFMKLPLWNADRSNSADVSLRISVRKIDEKEVYSTHQFLTLPVANGPTHFLWAIPVDVMRTGNGEPDYRLKVELLKGGSTVLDQFSVEYRLGPPVPEITSVSPDPATVGEEITITGKNFGKDQYEGEVSIDDNRLFDIKEWTDTKIRVKLPSDARTGELYVKVGEQESEPYPITVQLQDDLLPKLQTSIVAIASFQGLHSATDGTQFDDIRISSAVTGQEIEWNGTSFKLEYDWSEADGSGGTRKYTFRINGTVAPRGDSIVSLSALYSERWEAPDNAFVQIDTKELIFGGVQYQSTVVSSDQQTETLLYYLSGAGVRSRLTRASWKVTDETGDVKFAYDTTDWEEEFAPPMLSVGFGRRR